MKKFFSLNRYPLIFLLLFITIGFFYSVSLRKPWMGVFSESGHQWVTAHSLLITRQWYNEGLTKFKFGLPLNPPSIEFPNTQSRGFYYSYPNGTFLPLYLASKILRHQPNISMVMKYNLCNQLLITLTLSLISYIILFKNGFSQVKSLFISLSTASIILFSPGPFYFFQNVYFSDEAVLFPISLIILFEALKIYSLIPNNRLVKFLESLIIFYALWTDWLAVFVVIVLFINNIISQRSKIKTIILQNFYLIIPSILFVSLFVYQTYILSGFADLKDRFFLRLGMNGQGKAYITNFFGQFWRGHAFTSFGLINLCLLAVLIIIFFISIFLLIINKKNRTSTHFKLLLLINLILIPYLTEIYTLKNHSAVHNFSTLKLLIPISLSIPLIISFVKTKFNRDITNPSITGLNFSTYKRNYPIEISLFLILIILFGINLIRNPQKIAFFPKPNYLFNDVSEFIRKNTDENTIVFSPNFQIPVTPPQRLSLSLKRVYFINNVDQIKDKINDIKSDKLTIALFILGKEYPQDKEIQALIDSAYEVKTAIVNTDQRDTAIIDLNVTDDIDGTAKSKAIQSIYHWSQTNNQINLYKIKL